MLLSGAQRGRLELVGTLLVVDDDVARIFCLVLPNEKRLRYAMATADSFARHRFASVSNITHKDDGERYLGLSALKRYDCVACDVRNILGTNHSAKSRSGASHETPALVERLRLQRQIFRLGLLSRGDSAVSGLDMPYNFDAVSHSSLSIVVLVAVASDVHALALHFGN